MRMKYVSLLFVFVLAVGILAGCSDQQPASPTPQAPVIAIQVKSELPAQQNAPTVWVPPVYGAGAKDEQSIAVAPEDMMASNWAVVLDNSGSMTTKECSGQDSRMVAGGKAVISFSAKRPAHDNFGLVLFTGSSPYARVAAPLGRDRTVFVQEVQKASPDFNTPLGPAIEVAYAELFKQGKRQGWYGSYHIVVVTDGDWNQGSDPGPIVQKIVRGSPVQIHTVGFCTGEKHRLNIPGFTSYASADNAEQVNKGLQAVLAAESDVFTDSQFK